LLLRTLGKSLLVAVGFAYGILRGIHLVGKIADNAAAQKATDARLSTLELAVASLGEQTHEIAAQAASNVTRTEFAAALDEAFSRIRHESETRFEQNARSTEALREMVGQTDELLQKVLDGLEELRDAHETVG
jgi:hypothetical protein